jgi:hypothetical protein
MEIGDRARRRWSLTFVLGTGALAADLALTFVPFSTRSFFSALVLADLPARAVASNVLALFSTAAVIAIGLGFVARREAVLAAGAFLAIGALAAIRAAADILITDAWPWQTVLYVGLKVISSALLFAAAIVALRVNRRGGMP